MAADSAPGNDALGPGGETGSGMGPGRGVGLRGSSHCYSPNCSGTPVAAFGPASSFATSPYWEAGCCPGVA